MASERSWQGRPVLLEYDVRAAAESPPVLVRRRVYVAHEVGLVAGATHEPVVRVALKTRVHRVAESAVTRAIEQPFRERLVAEPKIHAGDSLAQDLQPLEGERDVYPRRLQLVAVCAAAGRHGLVEAVEGDYLFGRGDEGHEPCQPLCGGVGVGDAQEEEGHMILVEARQHVSLNLINFEQWLSPAPVHLFPVRQRRQGALRVDGLYLTHIGSSCVGTFPRGRVVVTRPRPRRLLRRSRVRRREATGLPGRGSRKGSRPRPSG